MGQPPYDPYGGQPQPYGVVPQQPYGQPVQQYAMPGHEVHHYHAGMQPRTNGLAVAGMVLGIIGLFTCGLTSILAIIFGHVSYSQIKRTGEGGSGMAVAAIVTGWIVTVLWLLYWLAIVLGYAALIGSTSGSSSGVY